MASSIYGEAIVLKAEYQMVNTGFVHNALSQLDGYVTWGRDSISVAMTTGDQGPEHPTKLHECQVCGHRTSIPFYVLHDVSSLVAFGPL